MPESAETKRHSQQMILAVPYPILAVPGMVQLIENSPGFFGRQAGSPEDYQSQADLLYVTDRPVIVAGLAGLFVGQRGIQVNAHLSGG